MSKNDRQTDRFFRTLPCNPPDLAEHGPAPSPAPTSCTPHAHSGQRTRFRSERVASTRARYAGLPRRHPDAAMHHIHSEHSKGNRHSRPSGPNSPELTMLRTWGSGALWAQARAGHTRTAASARRNRLTAPEACPSFYLLSLFIIYSLLLTPIREFG